MSKDITKRMGLSMLNGGPGKVCRFLDVAGVDGAIFYRPKDKGDQVFSHGVSPQNKGLEEKLGKDETYLFLAF